MTATANRKDFELDHLLHPAGAFRTPMDVVADPDLTLNEKRAILASWASDACAVESAPALRHGGPGQSPIGFDDVMDALRTLDRQAADSTCYRRHERRRRIFKRPRHDDGHGSAPLET